MGRSVLRLGLAEARRVFFVVRKDKRCVEFSEKHIFKDHPERMWTRMEIIHLLCEASGTFSENNAPSAQDNSWLWTTTDEDERECKFPLRLEEDEQGRVIFVITAIR